MSMSSSGFNQPFKWDETEEKNRETKLDNCTRLEIYYLKCFKTILKINTLVSVLLKMKMKKWSL